MKAADVIVQLQTALPQFTNLFTDEVNIVGITSSNGIVTVETDEKHGFLTGSYVNISGVLTKNKLTSVTLTGKKAEAITTYPHALSYGFQCNSTITGALNSNYNGDRKLLAVESPNKFTFEVLGNPPSPPMGDMYLIEDRYSGFNGWHAVTVIDEFTFSYVNEINIPYLVPEPPGKCRFNVRVSGAATVEKAIDSYTQYSKQSTKDKSWAFVVLADVAVSKDRGIDTDVTNQQQSGDIFRQRLIQGFSVFVITPSIDNISGRKPRDLMEDVCAYLFNSLLKIKFPNGFSEQTWSQTTSIGHGLVALENAYYVHEFRFEAVADVIWLDAALPDVNVPFRQVTIDFLNQDPDSGVVELQAIVKINEND